MHSRGHIYRDTHKKNNHNNNNNNIEAQQQMNQIRRRKKQLSESNRLAHIVRQERKVDDSVVVAVCDSNIETASLNEFIYDENDETHYRTNQFLYFIYVPYRYRYIIYICVCVCRDVYTHISFDTVTSHSR